MAKITPSHYWLCGVFENNRNRCYKSFSRSFLTIPKLHFADCQLCILYLFLYDIMCVDDDDGFLILIFCHIGSPNYYFCFDMRQIHNQPIE